MNGRSKRAAALLVVALLLGAVVVWIASGQLIAAAPHTIGQPPLDLDAQSVSFASDSGSTIHGWLCRGREGQGAVLLLHGVRGNRLDMVSRAEFLRRLGYSILLIDFQAHGESPGANITFGYLESRDVTASLRYLHHELPAERVGVIGVSMGAAAYVLADGRPTVDAVVLESMYPTIDQAVRDRLRLHFGVVASGVAPLLMIPLEARLGIEASELRPIQRMQAVHAPVFLVSGALDRHTDISEARDLFTAASQPKRFWAVEGAGHVNLHHFARAEYERKISEFFGQYLLQQSHDEARAAR